MENKKTWIVELSQNGWEYIGILKITAVMVEKIGTNKLNADGVEMEFDEDIREPYEASNQ